MTVEVETPGAGRNLVALLALGRHAEDPGGMNDLAQRAFAAHHRAVTFQSVGRLTGKVSLQGPLIPALVTFADPDDPASARFVNPQNPEASLGEGYHLNSVTLEMLPVGFWPLDVGGPLGEPFSRGIEQKLPWLQKSGERPLCNVLQETCLGLHDFVRD